MCTIPIRTLNDDVVVPLVFDPMIPKSILASVSIQIQPVFSQRLVYPWLHQFLPRMDFTFVHTATAY